MSGDLFVPTAAGRVDRSASLVRIARVLHGAGVAPAQIAETLAERDVNLGWHKYCWRQDAATYYARIVSLVVPAR